MPGTPSSRRSSRTSSVITPRSSATSGSSPSARRGPRRTARGPGPGRQRPAGRGGGSGRYLPVAGEGPEVVDPDEIGGAEGMPQAARSTRCSRLAHPVPAVQRVSPQLAVVAVGVRAARRRRGAGGPPGRGRTARGGARPRRCRAPRRSAGRRGCECPARRHGGAPRPTGARSGTGRNGESRSRRRGRAAPGRALPAGGRAARPASRPRTSRGAREARRRSPSPRTRRPAPARRPRR